jgi:hypothetical protein
MNIHGYCDPKFKAVENAFRKNFESHREKAASLCIYLKGKVIVHLFGEISDQGKHFNETSLVFFIIVYFLFFILLFILFFCFFALKKKRSICFLAQKE